MDDNNQQGQTQKAARSEDDSANEFDSAGRQQQGMEKNDSLGDHEGSFDDAGQGDPSKQQQAPLGSTNPPESRDSWRPSADPAAGDMAKESDRDEVTS